MRPRAAPPFLSKPNHSRIEREGSPGACKSVGVIEDSTHIAVAEGAGHRDPDRAAAQRDGAQGRGRSKSLASARQRNNAQRRAPRSLPIVLLVGVALSVAAFSLLQRGETARVEAELRYRSTALSSSIRQRLNTEFALLASVARFLSASTAIA